MNAQEILKRKLPLSEFGHPIWSESSVLSAMEEYAQQSQSNPSKLVKSLQDVMESENESEPLSSEIIDMQRQAQQALESYKDGWVRVEERLPELKDGLVLGFFTNGSIETIHIEDWFSPITSGIDEQGNQKYSLWYLSANPSVTHWQPLPQAPIQNTNIQNK